MSRMLAALARLEVWGQTVITDQVVEGAFDILRLIATQRARVTELEERARQRQAANAELGHMAELRPAPRRGMGASQPAVDQALAMAQMVAAGVARGLEAQVGVQRYQAYDAYLAGLERLYSRELPVVDLAVMRRAFRGGRR